MRSSRMNRSSRFWLILSMFSGENSRFDEVKPVGDREFALSISMITGALAVFSIIVRMLGA